MNAATMAGGFQLVSCRITSPQLKRIGLTTMTPFRNGSNPPDPGEGMRADQSGNPIKFHINERNEPHKMTESVPPTEASGPDHTNETPENLMDRLQREARETLGLDLEVPPRIVDLSDDATGREEDHLTADGGGREFEGLSPTQLRQIGDALSDASDLLTERALKLGPEGGPVADRLLVVSNEIGNRGIRFKRAANDAEGIHW